MTSGLGLSVSPKKGSSARPPPPTNPLFDPVYYGSQHPALAPDHDDLYNHFLHVGWRNGANPNAYFDIDWYTANNKDVKASGQNPLDHYLACGASEGRDPSPAFSTLYYLVLYPDVRLSRLNPLLHFLQHGCKEGRIAPPTFLCPPFLAHSGARGSFDIDRKDLAAALPFLRRLDLWTKELLASANLQSIGDPTTADNTGMPAVSIRGALPASGDCRATADETWAEASCHSRRAPRELPRAAKEVAARTVERRSPLWVRVLRFVFARQLASCFDAVRLLGRVPSVEGPLVIYTNHPSWWEPVLFHWLACSVFPGRWAFGVMNSAHLAQYSFLERIGVFAAKSNSYTGTVNFLATSERVLQDPRGLLFVVAEGRFRDVRDRPIRLKSGLGHLARRIPAATFVPMAIEFVFWNRRRPNILLHFGDPIQASGLADVSTPAAITRLEQALERTMGALAEAGQSRVPERFRTLLTARDRVLSLHQWLNLIRGFTGGKRQTIEPT